MHIIELENMEFFARHGCFAEEQIIGNKFLVYVRLESDETTSENSDNIDDAVNYQTAYNIIKREMMKPSHLLENVCKRIIDALYSEMANIKKIKVKVSKLNPPMGGKIGCASVTMER